MITEILLASCQNCSTHNPPPLVSMVCVYAYNDNLLQVQIGWPNTYFKSSAKIIMNFRTKSKSATVLSNLLSLV